LADFDHIAASYDNSFTNTPVGKAQRDLVYASLKVAVPNFNELNVLEINCGTGEDAAYFARQGANIVATDISMEMIETAKQKHGHQDALTFSVLDINDLDTFLSEKRFDLIFSNFGGLNCLTNQEIEKFLNEVSNKLNPKGKLCMVIMPEKCAWETLYFAAKLRFGKAFRRGKSFGVAANVEGKNVMTYYYSPKRIQSLASQFKTIQLNPIGLFVPPSYLDPFFTKRPKKLEKLLKKDLKRVKNHKFSSISDHYFICLEKK
jgi:ubiquinone/menaquinone biosynthesis C-methylase UbiE